MPNNTSKSVKKTKTKTKRKTAKRTNGFTKTVGSRAEVFHGTAKKTSGGLMKSDLIKNKRGLIVSKKKSDRAKKERRLEKAGYTTKPGVFKLSKKKKSKKQNK